MDIMKSLIGDKTAGVLVSGLIGRGFTREQAERFLPEVGSSVISAITDEGKCADANAVLGTINISDMVSKVGIDRTMVSNGLKYVVPGVIDLVGVNDADNIFGKAKGFFQSSHEKIQN